MRQYANMLQRVLDEGVDVGDRTGTGTRCVFGHQERFNLLDGFPLVTGKKVNFNLVLSELLWFCKGLVDEESLKQLGGAKKNGNTIWTEWAKFQEDPNCEVGTHNVNIGPLYGYTWRNIHDDEGNHYDQMKTAIETIKKNPDSRRVLVSAWHVPFLDKGALYPCHVMFQLRSLPMQPHEKEKWRTYLMRSGQFANATAENKLSLQIYIRSEWSGTLQ